MLPWIVQLFQVDDTIATDATIHEGKGFVEVAEFTNQQPVCMARMADSWCWSMSGWLRLRQEAVGT